MGVLAKDRGESAVEFLNTAFELEKFTLQVCHRENVIPKRYRLTIGNKMIHSAGVIHDNVIYANSIYVKNRNDFERRINFQKKAQLEIQLMLKDLRLIGEVLPVKDNVLEAWTGYLLKEEALIKGWMESDEKRYSKYKDSEE